ncbi:LacI family DNA-binding transcriptional regulator [Rathayibacter sp. CAU 1779]
MTDTGRASTMRDVAAEAGVSRAAVSKVVRNAYGVSPEMRTRVETAIAKLDFRPSLAARAIRGASFTIGFELHELENPAIARILRGAAEGIDGSGYRLVVAPASGAEGYEAIETLADLRVDGLVVVSPHADARRLEEIAERVPMVVLSRHSESEVFDTVTGDDAAGTQLALRHLFQLGHRRIAHLTRSDDMTAPGLNTPPSVRLQEYRRIMTQDGLDDEINVVRTAAGVRDGYDATVALLTAPQRPTAIFAMNDDLALGAMRAVAEAHLKPSQLSVVGYDNTPIAAHPMISLTSVDQSGDVLGRLAVEVLLDRIDGRTASRHESTSPRLMARGSSANSRT